jgi:predicted ATPase
VAVYHLHKAKRISFLPAASFENPAVRNEPIIRTLEAAVHDWLKYMGVADTIKTEDQGKLGHELKITTAGVGTPHDLTHVGVGVSQVLPIVVSCLLADKDTTLILEQPELHLHPFVQARLGDFFLAMALVGKQCILETHSEYLVNRLRFRAAAASGNFVSALISLYFVEKKEGASSFRPVVVNEYGAIPDWPEGFFDQSQHEAEEILREATRKRKSQRGDRKNA